MKNFVRIICEKIVNVVFYLYFSYYKFVVTFWCSIKYICIALILFSRTYNYNERSVLNTAPSLSKKSYFIKGTPSLAGRPLSKNSPPDCF